MAECRSPPYASKKKSERVIKIQNYSRALTLASATGPLGTVLQVILGSKEVASILQRISACVLNSSKIEKWNWSKLRSEQYLERKVLDHLINEISDSSNPWRLLSHEVKKVKKDAVDEWDLSLMLKVLGMVCSKEDQHKEACDALEKLKNHVRNVVMHAGPMKSGAYGKLKTDMLDQITQLLEILNFQGLPQNFKENITEWIEFIVKGKCCMLNSKSKRDYVRELMFRIVEHLNKYNHDSEDLRDIKKHFGKKENVSLQLLLVHICTELPDDREGKVGTFISKFMRTDVSTILNKQTSRNAWLEGYTVTYKFLEHVKADETVNQYQQTIAENFSAVFQHIRYGCTELSFVMEDIHAHCLPAKILDHQNFAMLKLQGQRPVVTMFGCLAFSPSEHKYEPYFMGTKDTRTKLLAEYDALINKSDKDAADQRLLEESKKILEKLEPLEDDPSEDDLSEDDPPQGPPVPQTRQTSSVEPPSHESYSPYGTQVSSPVQESGVPVPQTRQTSSVKTHASHESYSLHGTQMSSPVQESPVLQPIYISSGKPPSFEKGSPHGTRITFSAHESQGPQLLKPIYVSSDEYTELDKSLSRYREQRTHAVSGAEVRSRRVKRLAVVFCNNITKEEYAQKSKCWYDALIQRDFHVQVAQDATLSTFEAFCEDCEGCECVAFVFNGVSSSTGQSINLKSGERTEQSMTNLSQKIINSLLINPKLKHCRIMMFFDTTNPIPLKIILGVTESAECVARYIAAANSGKGDFSRKASEALKTSSSLYDDFEEDLTEAISGLGEVYTREWDH